MRRENPRWEYRRETSAYDKSDYRSKFYKGKWEKAWIKNRIQYASDKKIDLYESMWEGYVDKTEHMPKSLFKFFPFNHNSLKCIENNSVFMNNPVLRSLSTRRKLRKNMVKQQIQGYLFNKSTKYGERRCA